MLLNTTKTLDSRRQFLRKLAATGAFFTVSGLYAEALAAFAPKLTEGPYYPLADDIPLDKDNDLVLLGDSLTPATGQIHYISGRILDASGNTVKDALVELWHCDAPAVNTSAKQCQYIQSTGVGRNAAVDPNFAGFGQFLTGSSGAYLFRTVKAGLYNGRTRHYHLAVTFPGQTSRYCTQLGWNETALATNGQQWATQNTNDNIFASLTTAQKSLLLLTYSPVAGTTTNEVAATFDFQVNLTPVEPTYPAPGGFILQPQLVAGPTGGNPRFALTFPVYAGYTYEVYGNPTLADLGWRALPFSLTQTGTIDRNKQTITADGSLTIFVEEKAAQDFYKITFRVPGANTGTPTGGGGPP